MFNNNKIYNVFKNTYGKFVVSKAIKLLRQEDKFIVKDIIIPTFLSNKLLTIIHFLIIKIKITIEDILLFQ
jgi:hypothetical protein